MSLSVIFATVGLLEMVIGFLIPFAAIGGRVAMTEAGSRMSAALLISGAILLSVWGHRC